MPTINAKATETKLRDEFPHYSLTGQLRYARESARAELDRGVLHPEHVTGNYLPGSIPIILFDLSMSDGVSRWDHLGLSNQGYLENLWGGSPWLVRYEHSFGSGYGYAIRLDRIPSGDDLESVKLELDYLSECVVWDVDLYTESEAREDAANRAAAEERFLFHHDDPADTETYLSPTALSLLWGVVNTRIRSGDFDWPLQEDLYTELLEETAAFILKVDEPVFEGAGEPLADWAATEQGG